MAAETSNSDKSGIVERAANECLDRGWRLAWLMLRHHDDASDAVQQAFVVALAKWRRIPRDNPWPWLAAVISREALHIRRKRARTVALDSGGSMPIEDVRATQPLSELERRERDEQLTHALGELPQEERDALLLTQLGGMTYAQAATALGVPLGTLNHRVSRAFATLRRKLDKDERAVASSLAVLPVLAPPPQLRESLATQAAIGASASSVALLGGLAVKKTTVVIACLLLVLLLGGGGIAYVALTDTPSDNFSPIATKATPRIAGSKEGVAATSEVEDDGAVASVPSETSNRAPTTDPRTVAETEEPSRRVLIATDPGGAPVSASFVVEWRVDDTESWASQPVRTGTDGRADLDAPIAAVLRVTLAETETERILGWGPTTIKGEKVEAPITVYGIVPARVRITYTDGKPYVGLVSVRAKGLWSAGVQMYEASGGGGIPLPVGWPAGRRGEGWFHEIIEFAGLPDGVDISFRTIASRAGYTEVDKTISADEIAAGRLIEIVIPAGVSPNTPGKVVLVSPEGVTLDGYVSLHPLVTTNLRVGRGWSIRYPVSGKPGEFEMRLESGNVRAGTYVLYIYGKTPWYSGEFEVDPGQVKEVTPVPTEPASLTVRVVDVEGNPLPGAVLSPAIITMPQTIAWRGSSTSPRPGEAETGADGVAKLEKFPAGTFDFQVYATGYQPWQGSVTLVAGQENDLGTLIMDKAAGRIEVQFPDWDFSKRKVTWRVTDDGARSTFAMGTVESSKLVIDGLPVGRTYKFQSSIPLGSDRGSRAFWYTKAFDLTRTAPTHVLDGTDKKWPDDLD